MGAPCSVNPLPRLALAWRKALLWLLVKVGVEKTPVGSQEKALNLVSPQIGFHLWWCALPFLAQKDAHRLISTTATGQLAPSTILRSGP